MKKIFYLAASAAILTFAACSNDGGTTAPDGDPIFPEPKTGSVSMNDGSVFAYSFTPNLPAQIIAEGRTHFKVTVNGEEMTAPTYNVDAGKAVEIKVTGRTEDFGESHTLTLSLKMGGQTQEIAKVTMMPSSSSIAVYTAELNEDGKSFKVITDENGTKKGYVYSSTPLANGAAIGLYEYDRNHLQVVSNRSWTAAAPEWLSMSQKSGRSGETLSIDIEAAAELRPFDDTEGELAFISSADDVELAKFVVKVDGCANEFSAGIPNSTNSVLKNTADTTTGRITAAYGSNVFFAFPSGTPEWIRFVAGKGFGDNSWNDAEKSAGLHTKEFTAAYDENTSYTESRRAFLFCIPLGVKGLNPANALNGDNVADEFAAYLIAAYTQPYGIEPRDENTLFMQSMIGQSNSSTAGQELFALLQEYDSDNYPEGWWGDALKNMPTVYELAIKAPKYGEITVMDIEHMTDWKIFYHPDDEAAATNWIKDLKKDLSGNYYFSFDVKTVGSGDNQDIVWTKTPKCPEAYIIFSNNSGDTGALLLRVSEEGFDIPLQNASSSIGKDVGFSVLTPGNRGYSERYAGVPQYKVNGYDNNIGQPDLQGRLNTGALLLIFNGAFNIDFDKCVYEAVEDGVMTDSLDPASPNYIFGQQPAVYGVQVMYTFSSVKGPDMFRIVYYNTSGELVCTVYIYYESV